MSERTEFQVAADVAWLLLVSGCIDRRRWNAHQLSQVIGCSIEDLERSRRVCEAEGYERLQPRARTESRGPAARSARNPDERRCPACGEDLPIDRFPVVDGKRDRLCEICTEFRARDRYVAIRKATALKQVIAWFTAFDEDGCVGDICPECEKPIEVGQAVRVQGIACHAEC